MKTLLYSLLRIRNQQRRSALESTAGFTMIELLVGTIIAFLITIPLLSFVVDILNRDVKEEAKASTEQEIQAAMDYIAQDMSQAFYIYTEEEVKCIQDKAQCVEEEPTVDGDEAIARDVGTAIVVFWKRNYIEDALPLDQDAASGDQDYCKNNSTLCDDAFVFSLVTYYLVEETDTDSVWCEQTPCPSRIARLEIRDNPKYLASNEYVTEAPDNGFEPNNLTNVENPQELIKGAGDFPNSEVLVNYIADFSAEAPTAVTAQHKLTKVTILGNAKIRIPGQFQNPEDCESDKGSSYCPSATAQVGALSGI